MAISGLSSIFICHKDYSFSYALLGCYLSFVHQHGFSEAYTISSYTERPTLLACVRRFLILTS